MQSTLFTETHVSKFVSHHSSTISSSGIHVAVRRTSERTSPQVPSLQQEPLPPPSEDDTYSRHLHYFDSRLKQTKPGLNRRKPPVVIPKKHKSSMDITLGSSLWATDSDNDLHSLEEKYRLAAHEVKLYEDSQMDELEYIASRRPSDRQSQSRDGAGQGQFRPVSGGEGGRTGESRRNSQSDPDGSDEATHVEVVVPEPKKEKSKAKNKLMNLNKFVLGHTARKVTSNWDLVENKFNASQTHDVVIVKGDNGIGNPVKIKTLPLSSLTLLLCSAQLQLKYKELNTLYTTMKYTPAEVEQSCKIAARKLVLSASSNPEVQLQCQDEIADLLAGGEPKVRIDALQENVFSSDPEDRKKEMMQLEKARAERVKNLMEEKRRKQENAKKAEARKKKSIFDFENSMASVQYPRGVINEKRMEHLKGIIESAYDMLLEAFHEKAVAVDPFVVDLIGSEMFPNTGNMGNVDLPTATKEEIKAAAFEKAGFVCRQFSPESRKIDLLGPPCLIELLRRTVALGKGLYGTSFNDVMELVQAYAATRIAAYYRGFTRRWRYRVARRAWKHLYNFMKSKIFKAWANEMRMMKNLRKYCFRKLTAWKYYTKSNFKRRYKFRVCFWPFFVWR
jgi:hypothetical protein